MKTWELVVAGAWTLFALYFVRDGLRYGRAAINRGGVPDPRVLGHERPA